MGSSARAQQWSPNGPITLAGRTVTRLRPALLGRRFRVSGTSLCACSIWLLDLVTSSLISSMAGYLMCVVR